MRQEYKNQFCVTFLGYMYHWNVFNQYNIIIQKCLNETDYLLQIIKSNLYRHKMSNTIDVWEKIYPGTKYELYSHCPQTWGFFSP